MTTLGSDSFTRSNVASPSFGTATDGETWARPFGSATTYSVTSNKGVIANTPGTWDHFVLGTNTISTTMDVLVHITPDATTENFGVLIRVSSVGTTDYKVMYEGDLGTKGLYLYYDSPGTGLVQLGSVSAFALTIGHGYWIRGQINGTTLMGKIWDDSGGEPGSWTLSSSVGTHTITSGGFGLFGAANTNLKFDSFTATDGTTTTNQPVTYVNTVASIESLSAKLVAAPNETTASVELILMAQSATMSNTTAIIEIINAGTFQQVINNNVTAIAEAVAIAQRIIPTGITANVESVLMAQSATMSNTTASIENTIGVSAPAVSSTDPNSQMLYDDLQIQYERIRGSSTNVHLTILELVYYPPAQVLSEHAVPGELDALLSATQTWSQLRTINDVTAFLVANP